MKKFFRFLIPFLLFIAVVGSAVWYLFVYDRDFTRDVLLYHARSFESKGNHSAAAVLYDMAYAQSGEEDEIAIELAQQYIAAGNYTKAEYTLSKAISNRPSADLYAELCRTYVKQDKLMDAVTMLDTISDPDILAELEAMRPAVPTATPTPDFYSQYITVEILAQEGTVYVSTDGNYPSVTEHAYTGPLELVLGENKIYTLAVGENGLVSRLGIYGYTIGGIIEQVKFNDPAVEAAIRQALGVAENITLFTNDLWVITELVIPAEAESYQDLSLLPYLQKLTVDSGIPDELRYLISLKELTTLHIYNCAVSDEILNIIAALPCLNTLTLQNCSLSTIAPLSAATGLVWLNLSDNTLRNLMPISGMTGLRELNLAHNALTDLSALSGLTELQLLDASYNSLASIEPICHLSKLRYLDVSNNKLSTLGSVRLLTGLTHLYAQHNSIMDASRLSACTQLQELNISYNAVQDITALSTLTNLTYFNFSNNTVTALPVFAAECPLVTIDGSHNLLVSIAELTGLADLNNVLMDYNEALTDLTPLDSCPRLVQVNVYGTLVTEVSFLLEKSVIVNYNPALAS